MSGDAGALPMVTPDHTRGWGGCMSMDAGALPVMTPDHTRGWGWLHVNRCRGTSCGDA